MPQAYSGGGPDYSGAPHTGIGGGEHGHCVRKDEPPNWDSKNPETRAEPYLKTLYALLVTPRTMMAQQGVLIQGTVTRTPSLTKTLNKNALKKMVEDASIK